DRLEVGTLEAEAAHRLGEEGGHARIAAGVEAVEVGAPQVERRGAAGAVALLIVGDVVDGAAEGVDGEHRFALAQRHGAHGGVEGALAHLGPQRLHVDRRDGPGLQHGGPVAHRLPPSLETLVLSMAPSAIAPILALSWCTLSDRGSRVINPRQRSSASAWITPTSSARRPSLIFRANGRERSSRRMVSWAKPLITPRRAGEPTGAS